MKKTPTRSTPCLDRSSLLVFSVRVVTRWRDKSWEIFLGAWVHPRAPPRRFTRALTSSVWILLIFSRLFFSFLLLRTAHTPKYSFFTSDFRLCYTVNGKSFLRLQEKEIAIINGVNRSPIMPEFRFFCTTVLLPHSFRFLIKSLDKTKQSLWTSQVKTNMSGIGALGKTQPTVGTKSPMYRPKAVN